MNPIRDVDELRTAIDACASMKERRQIVREARRLGRTDILPRGWVTSSRFSQQQSNMDNIEQILALKADASGIGVAKLRCVYMRGVMEYDAMESSPLSRDAWAHARVNSFIRLSAGSQIVRKDDADLLAS